MAVVAKLTENGEFKVAGNVDTRLPLVTEGLVAHYPFDGTTSKYIPSNIRYVRDWLNGSTANTSNHWNEIQIIDYTGTNRALGLTATSNASFVNPVYYTDGIISSSYSGNSSSILAYAQIDLGAQYNIRHINTWHYYPDSRTYNDTKIEVSEDGILWYSIFDSAIEGTYVETIGGKLLDLENLGTTVMPTTETNVVKNVDGVFIGSDTTNLYTDGQYITKTLHPVRSGNWTFPTNIFGPDGQNVIQIIGTGYHGRDITVIDATDYTTSALLYVSLDYDGTYFRIAGENAFAPDAFYDLSKKGTWQRVHISGVTIGTTARILIYADGTEGKCYATDLLFEQKNHNTVFTETTRGGNGSLTLPFNLLPPYTIQFKHKSSWPYDNQIDQGTYPYIIQMGNYYSNASISYWNYGKSLKTYIKGDASGVWTATPTHFTYSAATWDNVEHNYALVAVNNTTFEVYMDGVKSTNTAVSSEDVTLIDKIMLGYNGDNEQATFRDFSIYNKALSEKEVITNAKGTHSVKVNETVTNSINSRPKIPNDCAFFDLGFTGNSRDNTIIPTEDLAVYTDGDAYMTSAGSIEYNFYQSIGLDWNADWSICYFKKPIGTYTGETSLTGYNIESFGCNSNSVGGGYRWFGKNNSSDSLASTTNTAFLSADYFEHWQCITVVKSGTTITFETWLSDKLQRTRTEVLSAVAANYYETQYGYDFKLSGWDNNNETWSHYKNLIVLKRAMTTQELDDYRLQKMKAYSHELLIQSEIETGVTL